MVDWYVYLALGAALVVSFWMSIAGLEDEFTTAVGVVLRLVTLPLRILTLGLFNIVINAALIGILSALPLGTHVRLHATFDGAFEAALVLAVVSGLADLVGGKKKVGKRVRKALT